MSLLFKELDCNKTYGKVDTFSTGNLEKLILIGGRSLTDLRSSSLSLTPSHSNGINHVEAPIIGGLNAEAEVRAIHHTIYHLPEVSKVIIRGLYVYRMENWQVVEAIKYGHTQYNVLRRKARLSFADSFDHQQRYTKCSPIIDLHQYKKDQKDTDKVMAKQQKYTDGYAVVIGYIVVL